MIRAEKSWMWRFLWELTCFFLVRSLAVSGRLRQEEELWREEVRLLPYDTRQALRTREAACWRSKDRLIVSVHQRHASDRSVKVNQVHTSSLTRYINAETWLQPLSFIGCFYYSFAKQTSKYEGIIS